MLFRIRWLADDARERTEFVGTLGLDWEVVGEEEKMQYANELLASLGGWVKRVEEENWFKVNWENVPELVEGRRVFLKGGMAYVPVREQMSMVLAEFTSRLEKALEVTSIPFDEMST